MKRFILVFAVLSLTLTGCCDCEKQEIETYRGEVISLSVENDDNTTKKFFTMEEEYRGDEHKFRYKETDLEVGDYIEYTTSEYTEDCSCGIPDYGRIVIVKP